MAATQKKTGLTEAQFTEIVAGYPDEMIACRDTGHHWKPITANREKKTGNILRVLTCQHCYADRHQTLDRAGYIISSHYSYQQGYLIPKVGRLKASHRAALRLASITRAPVTEAHTS